MASAFDETVFDFDSFLRQATENTVVHSKHDKHRKAILIAKKKTIATDSLIRKYYAKRELLEQTERTLAASKEECKQICIDYKLVLDRCSKLETDAQILENLKKELEAKSSLAENQCEALRSHCNQLQQLLKQHETEIETLKTEDKQGQADITTFENNIASLENEKAVLREHISNIIDLAGKKKINHRDKSLLVKYKGMYSNTCKQTLSEDDSRADETDIFDNSSPLATEEFFEANKDEGNIPQIHGQEDKHNSVMSITDDCNVGDKPALRKYDTDDRDSDCHEVSSVDTGRGSSLAFSGSDKCFHSPDYYLNDSPLATELFSNKEKRKQNDIATSPLRVIETVDKCTSPIIFDQYDFSNQLEHMKCQKVDSSKTSITPKILIEKAVSPIKFIMNMDVSTSPIAKTSSTTCPDTSYNVIQGKDAQEKECLENSINLSEDINDREIEAILSSMRLSHELITPIPGTPVKPHRSTATHCVNDTSIIHDDHSKSVCQEFERMREDNKLLHTSFADLAKKVTCQEFASEREDIKVLHTGIADLRKEINSIKILLKMRSSNAEEIKSGVDGGIRGKDEYFADNYVANMTNRLVDVNKTADSDKLNEKKINSKCNEQGNRQRRRTSTEEPEIQSKRMLRSSTIVQSPLSENNGGNSVNITEKNDTRMATVNQQNMKVEKVSSRNVSSSSITKHIDHDQLVNYNDADLLTDDSTRSNEPKYENMSTGIQKPQERVLCLMIERYRVSHVKNTPRKSRKRTSTEEPEIQSKRMLRSSTIVQSPLSENNIGNSVNITEKNDTRMATVNQQNMKVEKVSSRNVSSSSITKHIDHDQLVNYNDADLFTDNSTRSNEPKYENMSTGIQKPHESVLCLMIERYGVSHVKNTPSNIPDSATNPISKKIEEVVAEIAELAPNEAKYAMNKFVEEIRNMNRRHFITGLMKYLKHPERKQELFSKMNVPPAPPMTKSEQILIYIITQMKCFWPDIVDCILNSIEYTLFQLNRTPDFGVIESMSHFYAVLCRYSKAKNRLRLFVLDAMYCIQFKSVPLIRQCLDVWMHILPLAHMGIAKSPLVTCMVYLLHFFKCEDKFNRVQEIRNILRKKYFYEITEWNENKILELLRNSLKDLREIEVEKKMLRLALIILAKRLGPRWCQDNIIKKLLLPMVSDEKVPERIRQFCVSMAGPLLKPYPPEMKVHCEIVMNQLTQMLTCNPSQPMQEAIFTSLVYMSKHNQNGVLQALLSWKSKKITSDMESLLRDYVRGKPLKIWKIVLSKLPVVR